jgi:hypothetical protein
MYNVDVMPLVGEGMREAINLNSITTKTVGRVKRRQVQEI